MPKFSIKRHEQILTSMIAKVVARTRLSDVSNTSAWKHVLAAAARQDDEQYYQMLMLRKLFDLTQASGDDLDERAKEVQPFIITRELTRKASGNIVFYRTNTVGTVTFAAGIQVMTADGKTFTTTAGGSITPTSPVQIIGHTIGQDSGLIPAVANEGGIDGNVADNTIVKFVTKPIGIDGVINPSAFAYGLDEESDDSFRNRIIQYISTLARSTIQSIEMAVLGAEDSNTGARILFAKCIEDIVNRGEVILYIDDGTGSASTTDTVTGENVTGGLAGPPPDSATGGETYLELAYKPINASSLLLSSSISGSMVQGVDYYVDPSSGQLNFIVPLVTGEVITASYTYFTGLIALAHKIVYGDPADRQNYPGYRGAGVRVTVTTPQILIQTVELSIVVSEGYDPSEVEDQVRDTIRNYINALGISGDVIKNEIIKRVQSVSGIYDMRLLTPTENIILLDDQMARTTDMNIIIS